MSEKEILFTILRAEICGEDLSKEIKNAVTADLLEPLYTLAKKHDLAHIVGHTLGRLGLLDESAVGQEMKQQTVLAVYRYMYQNKVLTAACKALESGKIDHIPLKGSVIRKYYKLPWMRTSCDIDILVKEQALEEAVNVLKTEGFTFIKKGPHEITFHSSNKVCVELHYTLIEDTVSQKQAAVLEGIWEAATLAPGTAYRYELPDEMFYFYHVAHMAKHAKGGGCGIKPFVDMWILNHRISHDKARRYRLLEQGALMPFHTAAETLAECWLSGGQPDGMSAHLETFTLEGGVYGTLKQRIAVTQIQEGSKLKYALSKIVIPYHVIRYQYPILEKHPWLTPLYQVRRWMKLLFRGGVKRSIFTLKVNATRSQAEISSTEDLLRYLGL